MENGDESGRVRRRTGSGDHDSESNDDFDPRPMGSAVYKQFRSSSAIDHRAFPSAGFWCGPSHTSYSTPPDERDSTDGSHARGRSDGARVREPVRRRIGRRRDRFAHR